jgi:hypothetical protein
MNVRDFNTLNLPGTETPRTDYLGEISTGYGSRPYTGNTVFVPIDLPLLIERVVMRLALVLGVVGLVMAAGPARGQDVVKGAKVYADQKWRHVPLHRRSR